MGAELHTHLLQSHTASVSDVALSSCSLQPGCSAANSHSRLYLQDTIQPAKALSLSQSATHTYQQQLPRLANIMQRWIHAELRCKANGRGQNVAWATQQVYLCPPALDCICLHCQELGGRCQGLRWWCIMQGNGCQWLLKCGNAAHHCRTAVLLLEITKKGRLPS